MTDTTLTGVINTVADQTTDQAPEDYLEVLVGEGKKYRDPRDLAKAYINADLHIRELQSKLDERQGTEAMLQEVLGELRKSPTTDLPARSTVEPAGPVNADDIARTVDDLLARKEAERAAKHNTKTTLDKLTEFYGSQTDAVKAIKTLINGDPDMEEVINKLGNKDPEKAFKFITTQVPKHTSSTQITPGISDSAPANGLQLDGGLTWTKAQKIKKENPGLYNSKQFRTMLEAEVAKATAQGKDFFAT